MSNEYNEGAKALLNLKKKDKKKRTTFEDDKSKDDSRDVEAAVLKYVAGTLDNAGNTGSPSNRKRKKSFNTDDVGEVNEFQHWNSFLDTEQLQNAEDDQTQEEEEDVEVAVSEPEPKKHKKSRKKKNIDVDPVLANLDDATDHEQLVRAAILDAAQDANVNIQELHNSIIQAAEAAQQEQQQEQQQQAEKQVRDQEGRTQQDINKDSQSTKDSNQSKGPETNFSAGSVEGKASSSWVRKHSTGKTFTKEEADSIDNFLLQFCEANGLTRDDLCKRIWLNERKREIIWDLLHEILPDRTRASIYKHVRRVYHVFEVRGKWTPEDDDNLARLFVEKAGTWKLIGLELGRMPEDCRDRYRNYIKCGQNRVLNKWSAEEEDKLRDVVSTFISEQEVARISVPIINWTIISERMGGSRSRIQCRYKWNKLLKRESTMRADKSTINDRVWLLTKLQALEDPPEDDIEWQALASLHPKGTWSGADLKVLFNRLKSRVRDKKGRTTNEICQALLQDAIDEANRNNTPIELPVVLQHFEEAKRSDGTNPTPNEANIASAAISNSSRNNEEYVSWR